MACAGNRTAADGDTIAGIGTLNGFAETSGPDVFTELRMQLNSRSAPAFQRRGCGREADRELGSVMYEGWNSALGIVAKPSRARFSAPLLRRPAKPLRTAHSVHLDGVE